jgi:hypothetical protein
MYRHLACVGMGCYLATYEVLPCVGMRCYLATPHLNVYVGRTVFPPLCKACAGARYEKRVFRLLRSKVCTGRCRMRQPTGHITCTCSPFCRCSHGAVQYSQQQPAISMVYAVLCVHCAPLKMLGWASCACNTFIMWMPLSCNDIGKGCND